MHRASPSVRPSVCPVDPVSSSCQQSQARRRKQTIDCHLASAGARAKQWAQQEITYQADIVIYCDLIQGQGLTWTYFLGKCETSFDGRAIYAA